MLYILYYQIIVKKRKDLYINLSLFGCFTMNLKNLAALAATGVCLAFSQTQAGNDSLDSKVNHTPIIRPDNSEKMDSCVKARYESLGLDPRTVYDFYDTDRPNAAVVLPLDDKEDLFYRYPLKYFFKDIKNKYDTRFVVASSFKDIQEIIDSTPNIDLFVIAGHKPRDGSGIILSRDYSIKEHDSDFVGELCKLKDNATILLFSCYSANQGEGHDNTATFVKSHVGSRKVIGIRNSLISSKIKVNSYYPLNINIIDDAGKDIALKL
jgi:hypothetical protein